MAHSCCAIEDLRGLAPWNLPSFGFCGMRSGSYNSEVTNGEACRFLSRIPNLGDESSLQKTLGPRYARTLRQILRYFKYFIKEGHLLDDLPFGLWLGMILTVRVESMGLWGR